MKLHPVKRDGNARGDFLSYCYFHGKLEDDIGYDLVAIEHGTEPVLGIHNVEVEGYDAPCVAFIWKDPRFFEKEYIAGDVHCAWYGFRGLIVREDDTEHFIDAYQKYIEKAVAL